jgi:hypothetical protein
VTEAIFTIDIVIVVDEVLVPSIVRWVNIYDIYLSLMRIGEYREDMIVVSLDDDMCWCRILSDREIRELCEYRQRVFGFCIEFFSFFFPEESIVFILFE